MLSRVGNYELIRPLGSGGMAQTFLAKRRGPAGFEQTVCLKRILPEYAADAMLVEQFLDEARLLAHLRHANVVQVYDFGEADGSYFMALELVDGADLEALVSYLRTKRQPFPGSLALHIVTQTLRALHYAHNAELDGEPLHLVHRDISPSNILLSRAGEVKLADFGIAKSRHRRHKTRAGYTKGKVAYMSPEQVRGEALDARSDLFALGIVLHELLTGVHPFDADTDITLLNNIMLARRPAYSELAVRLPPGSMRLLDALLAADRTQRPESAADALALVPSLEHTFKIERELGELIAGCMALRASHSVAPAQPPAAAQRDDGPGRTTALPPSAPHGPSRFPAGADDATHDMPSHGPAASSESAGTDALMAAESTRRAGRMWLLTLAAVVLIGLAWGALQLTAPPPQPLVVSPANRPPLLPQPAAIDGSAPGPNTQPTAAQPTETPREREQEESTEPPSRAPRVLHEAQPDTHQAQPERTKKRERPVQAHRPRDGQPKSPAAPSAEPQRKEPTTAAPATAPAASPAPAPATPKPKHRNGVDISLDDFE